MKTSIRPEERVQQLDAKPVKRCRVACGCELAGSAMQMFACSHPLPPHYASSEQARTNSTIPFHNTMAPTKCGVYPYFQGCMWLWTVYGMANAKITIFSEVTHSHERGTDMVLDSLQSSC